MKISTSLMSCSVYLKFSELNPDNIVGVFLFLSLNHIC